MYIFTISVSPLSNEREIVKKENISPASLGIQNIYEYEALDVKGVSVVKKANEFMSIHKYDDERYSAEKLDLAPATEERGLSADISAYTYHNNARNDREIIGFLPYWTLSSYSSIQYDKLSTVAYFSLTCDNTGAWVKGYKEDKDGDGKKEWYDDGGWIGFNSTQFTKMVKAAHAKDTKVVLLVKNFDPYSIRQIVRNVDNAGDRLINNIIAAISSKNLDGVNIDFEYVQHKDSDTVTNQLRADFASWHNHLADTIHAQFPGSHVSTDTFGASAVNYTIYDMAALGKTSLDYLVMMTYDYITTSCWNGKRLAPMSPLYGNNIYGTPNWNTSSHLLAASALAGSKKIVMGIPYYGVDMQVKSDQRNTYNAYADYPYCRGAIETYASVVNPKYDAYHNDNTIKWNSTEKATWYAYKFKRSDGTTTYRQGYYDDARSLGAKYDFVKNSNLGGIAIWALGYDGHSAELYSVIKDKFQIFPFYILFENSVSLSKAQEIISANALTIESNLGNGVFKVVPVSSASSGIMKNLNKYKEVVKTDIEVIGKIRSIEL